MACPDKNPLVVIAGPTASGKSALALDLAERANGIVINADASQVYADLRLLSARPSAEDEARALHRLYGIVDGATACSAAMWADMARGAIAEAWAEAKPPILVGGTGLYIRTLLDGIAAVPEIDSAIRNEVRALSPEDAYSALIAEDPAAAATLNPADRQRVARALEVIRSTGRSLLAWHADPTDGLAARTDLKAYVVDVDRATLYTRCDTRFDLMLDQGALDEVARLRSRRLDPDLPVMKALGVPPLIRHLNGDLSLADAADSAKRDTRRYAKRQLTWFRNQTANWTRISGGDRIELC